MTKLLKTNGFKSYLSQSEELDEFAALNLAHKQDVIDLPESNECLWGDVIVHCYNDVFYFVFTYTPNVGHKSSCKGFIDLYKVEGVLTLTLMKSIETGVFNSEWRPSNTVYFSGKYMFYFDYEGE